MFTPLLLLVSISMPAMPSSCRMPRNFPSKKNAPFRGKFQGHLIMREIGSVAKIMGILFGIETL
jgi:hypothetical protein